MGAQASSLGFWLFVLLGSALILGLEAADLLFVASWTKRLWRERSLAFLPAIAFVGVLLAARAVRAQYDYWRTYLAFVATNYPASRYSLLFTQTQRDYADVLASVTRLGWIAIAITVVVVALGAVLIAHWSQPDRQLTILALIRSARAARAARASSAASTTSETSEVEFTIEPLDRSD
jgi:hypothetical protein